MTENYSILGEIAMMKDQYEAEVAVNRDHNRIFHQRRDLAFEEMMMLRNICSSQLKKESRILAVRVELFAMLYLCEPQSLFYKTNRHSQTVRDYAGHVMGIRGWRLSKYKQNLAFLYFRDRVFRSAVNNVLKAMNELPVKKSHAGTRKKSTSQWRNHNSK